jgi:hypothetical protein
VCLEALLPPDTDLLILEHLTYLDDDVPELAAAMERLLLRLQLHFRGRAMPAVLVLNMHRLLHGSPAVEQGEACLRNASRCSSDACGSTFSALPEPSSLLSKGGPA